MITLAWVNQAIPFARESLTPLYPETAVAPARVSPTVNAEFASTNVFVRRKLPFAFVIFVVTYTSPVNDAPDALSVLIVID